MSERYHIDTNESSSNQENQYDHVTIYIEEHAKKCEAELYLPKNCVVPLEARLNKNLCDGARIFLGELNVLTNKHGYCWASDQNLAQMKDVAPRTILRWLQQLENEKFIYRDTSCKYEGKTEDKKKIFRKKRKIYVFDRPTIVSKKVFEHDTNVSTIVMTKMSHESSKPLTTKESISKEIPKENPEPIGSSRPKPSATDSPPSPKKSKFYEDAKDLSHYHFKKIKESNPKVKDPNFENWAVDMEKLLRIDKVPKEEVREMLDWIFDHDDFWYKNILSPGKLRKKWDTLAMNRIEKKKKTNKNLKKQTGKVFQP